MNNHLITCVNATYNTSNFFAYKSDSNQNLIPFIKSTNFIPSCEKTCIVCNKDAQYKCTKCKSVYFCGKDCQSKAWPIHKKHCERNLFATCSVCGISDPNISFIKCSKCPIKFCSDKCKETKNHSSEECSFLLKTYGNKNECCICLEEIHSKSYTTVCNHVYDIKCIMKWVIESNKIETNILTSECPLCKNPILVKDIVNEYKKHFPNDDITKKYDRLVYPTLDGIRIMYEYFLIIDFTKLVLGSDLMIGLENFIECNFGFMMLLSPNSVLKCKYTIDKYNVLIHLPELPYTVDLNTNIINIDFPEKYVPILLKLESIFKKFGTNSSNNESVNKCIQLNFSNIFK
jgi:hypothetical protein